MATYYRIVFTAFTFPVSWLAVSLLLEMVRLEPPWLERVIYQGGIVVGLALAWLVFCLPIWKDRRLWQRR